MSALRLLEMSHLMLKSSWASWYDDVCFISHGYATLHHADWDMPNARNFSSEPIDRILFQPCVSHHFNIILGAST